MGWSEATFTNRSGKKQKVWVKSADDGNVVVDAGRVDMKYSDAEDAKVYRASLQNLSFDGATVGDPTPSRAPKPAAKTPVTSASTATFDELVWQSPEGERFISHDIPMGLEDEVDTRRVRIEAWTDGACTGNPGPAGYGVVLLFGDNYVEIGQYIGTGTNNIAELLAIRVALEELREVGGQVFVHTDSSYSIGVLSQGWKAKANTELVMSTRALIEEFEHPVTFVKVKGHAGIPLNERADRLAVEAIERHV